FRGRRDHPGPGICNGGSELHATCLCNQRPPRIACILDLFAHASGPFASRKRGCSRFRLDSLTTDYEQRTTDNPMAHAVAEEEPQAHMGLPLPHGKLAMWLFLVTEIMFFTGLIGTYIILRNGQPTSTTPWPTPHDVHLNEFIGAFNTFVLICSS